MTAVVYTTVLLFFFYLMVLYFLNMLSLSYPHEKVPWAALPTRVSFLIELAKFVIFLAYKETTLSMYILPYLNIVMTLVWFYILNKRLRTAIIFHTTVYLLTTIFEAVTLVIFLFAAFRDFVNVDRNYVFHLLWIISAIAMAVAAIFFREQLRYKFLSKVDFASYENDF